GWCDFCGKCAEVCPTGALTTTAGEEFVFDGLPEYTFHETEHVLGRAVINKDRCIIWQSKSTCTKCSESCPYGAISQDSLERPVVDESLCNGCGVCEYNCPSSRLLSYGGGSVRGIEVEPYSETWT
ncbi:MAG: 4Fe-4S binding protein, partial [Eggerthellaceae bacterium]|nr:4Fe-4S binding protein [Eggerthellaceae bacterium]